MKGFKATQSRHHKGGFREKNLKLALLLKGIKLLNRFIDSFDSFLEERCIGVALIDYFLSESRPPLTHASIIRSWEPFLSLINGSFPLTNCSCASEC
jgi:hypothetical protein